MEPFLQTLIDSPQEPRDGSLTAELRHLYDGALQFPDEDAAAPYVVANFVTTLDGVISYKIPGHAGGSDISGADQADRFVMGLLRACVDAVMVGAGTLHDVSPEVLWTPEYAYPGAGALYARLRRESGRAGNPFVVIVSGSGRVDLSRATFRTPGVRAALITTPAGRDRLMAQDAARMSCAQIYALDAFEGHIRPTEILALLRRLGVRRLLHEGGPTLFGSFLAQGAVNELFLTLSPQLAGRDEPGIRPALVQGVQFMPGSAPWCELLTVKRRSHHLFLRYRCRQAPGAPA